MVSRKLPAGDLCALPKGTVMALGCFDGLHSGHRALLRLADATAKKMNVPLAVWSPKDAKSGALLLSDAGKRAGLAALGAEYYVEEPFEEIRDLSCRAFVREHLVKAFGVSCVCCGENFTFGKDAAGDAPLLKKLCAENRIAFVMQETVRKEGETVSSTLVRKALEAGDAAKAAELLGEPFSFSSFVREGRKTGRTLGFPTINLPLPEKCPLARGVYAAKAVLQSGEAFAAIANVGVHPTFGAAEAPLCEAHLLGYSETTPLYGSAVKIGFIKRLRGEQTFPSAEALAGQLKNDLSAAESIFGLHFEKF